MLTRALALSWAPEDIRVSAGAPGHIETNINEAGRQGRPHYQRNADRTSFKRWGNLTMSPAPWRSCMPASSYATGTLVPIGGEFLAGRTFGILIAESLLRGPDRDRLLP